MTQLYYHPVSPNCRRVAFGLAEAGVPFTKIQVDPGKGDNRQAPYLKLNPMGKIPTVVEPDGFALWESPAILVYLAETHPEKGLLPAEPRARAEVFKWMFWNASHLEPAIFGVAFERILKAMRGKPVDEAALAVHLQNLGRYLPVLNAQLEGREYLVGPFSLADVDLACTVDVLFSPAAAVDTAGAPHVRAWHERIVARPAWKLA